MLTALLSITADSQEQLRKNVVTDIFLHRGLMGRRQSTTIEEATNKHDRGVLETGMSSKRPRDASPSRPLPKPAAAPAYELKVLKRPAVTGGGATAKTAAKKAKVEESSGSEEEEEEDVAVAPSDASSEEESGDDGSETGDESDGSEFVSDKDSDDELPHKPTKAAVPKPAVPVKDAKKQAAPMAAPPAKKAVAAPAA